MEIVKLDPKQFGIEESKAADIAAQFKPMLDTMVELEKEYNEVIALPIEDAAAKAKALRLKYVKVRTGTEKIHKEQKAFYLSAGRFVDGWKNAQLFASEGIEKKLEDIEQHAANIEKERLAEEKRLAEIEAEKQRIEEQRLENERLKQEAEEVARLRAEEQAKADAERKAVEEMLRIEKEKADAILKQEREEAARLAKIQADKLAAEQAAAAKVAAELQARKDAEAKAEADRIAAEKKAAKAPVKVKLNNAIQSLVLELPESELTPELLEKFNGFKQWALTKIASL